MKQNKPLNFIKYKGTLTASIFQPASPQQHLRGHRMSLGESGTSVCFEKAGTGFAWMISYRIHGCLAYLPTVLVDSHGKL